LLKIFDEKYKQEAERRRQERINFYNNNKEEKHYFPEILLNKYDVKEKILDKLPYIPS